MKTHCLKKKLFCKMKKSKGFWFHLIGIVCIVWFLVRVLPKPDRIRYPCQQMSITVALGYIAFWSAMFFGLIQLIKRAKTKTAAAVPSLLVIIMMLFALSTPVFGNTYIDDNTTSEWIPVPKDPIGTPQGVQPGRVTWVWNPNATEKQLSGYWWKSQNNNQTVIDQMYSEGLQALAGAGDDYDAWDQLFRYFNVEHGKGDVGYQSGEKIAIKINMNNGFYFPYTWESDDIDANPYAVKALLRQLVNIVGFAQEDITVYDASRKLMNWFYNRLCYEEYPVKPLALEFPDVNYVDMSGKAAGRQKVVASNERVYFAAGTCEYRTLPTCVTEADYLINMPIVKRHAGPWVTLSGKNLFGTWVEHVFPVHAYHVLGASFMGHPTPQTDLLGHEQLGQKTLLYVGDGTYGCRYGNTDIDYFKMYPFSDDWMNSLFFSQDPIAIDSVMYDFLHAEGAGGGSSEPAQNYLHQSAEPPSNTYDPENDGVCISDSLGVHEHWDTNIGIFSSNRYSGPEDGIDFIAIGSQQAPPNKPIISGPTSCKAGEDYEYTFLVTDPGGDDLYLWIEWGDGETSDWLGPYPSDEEVIVNHTWSEKGTYIIRAKVKNIHEEESDWGTFKIAMPRNKLATFSFFMRLMEKYPNAFPILRQLLN